MPEAVVVYNAYNSPCDFIVGPCCCGAWHDWAYWFDWYSKGRLTEEQFTHICDALSEAQRSNGRNECG
jgi:hypothetical protein